MYNLPPDINVSIFVIISFLFNLILFLTYYYFFNSIKDIFFNHLNYKNNSKIIWIFVIILIIQFLIIPDIPSKYFDFISGQKDSKELYNNICITAFSASIVFYLIFFIFMYFSLFKTKKNEIYIFFKKSINSYKINDIKKYTNDDILSLISELKSINKNIVDIFFAYSISLTFFIYSQFYFNIKLFIDESILKKSEYLVPDAIYNFIYFISYLMIILNIFLIVYFSFKYISNLIINASKHTKICNELEKIINFRNATKYKKENKYKRKLNKNIAKILEMQNIEKNNEYFAEMSSQINEIKLKLDSQERLIRRIRKKH